MSATALKFISSLSFIFLSLFFQSFASAANFDVAVQEGDKLFIQGLAAQLIIVGPSTSASDKSTLHFSGLDEASKEAGKWVLEKKENIITLKMNEFESKKDWSEVLSKNKTFRKIEIQGATLPIEVHLREGSISLQKWTREARLNVVQGKISSQNGSGTLQAHLQKGEVNISEHNGRIIMDSYSGNITIKSIQGDIEGQVFAGNVLLEKTKGFVNLNMQQTNAKINQSSGSLQFENGKGALLVQNFLGRIDGQTGEGALNISFLPESELNLRSKSGRVNIQAPANSGAALNLITVDGDIFVPKELRVNRLSTEKSVRGRLRGDLQKGNVLVRSQEGTITVK